MTSKTAPWEERKGGEDSQKIHFNSAHLTKGAAASPPEKMNFFPFVLIVHTAELKTVP